MLSPSPMTRKSGELHTKGDIQVDLLAVDVWAGRNGMLLNVSKSQYLHIWELLPTPLLIPDDNGTPITLLLVSSA